MSNMNSSNGENKIDSSVMKSNEKNTACEDVHIPVPWGHVSGVWWGPTNIQPLVALHGWQDNAATFEPLSSCLSKDVAILGIDLPGHGHSSHFPPGQFYYIFWEGVLLLRRIAKHYKWDKIKLLGHSLGGAISFLYAATYPDEVDLVISLDIVSPNVRDITKTVAITGDSIDKFLKYETLTFDNAPCYEYNEMIDIVLQAYNGSITRESAEILMKRGMKPALIPGKHYFSRDPRLKVSLLGMLSLDLVMAYAQKIKCSYLNIRAIPGMKFEQPENYHKVLDVIKETSKNFKYAEVEGTHHVHLNEPENVAIVINEFLNSIS